MVLKQDQQRVKALLKETITLLCKNGLHYKSEFCIEALIGITLDQDDVFLVSIKETIRDGLQAAKSSIQSTEVDTHAASLRGSKDKERMTSHNSVDLFPHKAHQSQHHSKPVDIDTDSVKTEIDQSNVYENDHNFTHSDDVKTEPMAGDAYNDKSVNVSEKRTFDEDDAEIERTENQAISPDLAENFKKRQKITELGEDNQCVSDDSDVVFIKDEPLSDTELEQVTLGLAEAEHSQAMQEFPYYPQTSHSGIPSGRTEPLPGCSNWNDPAEGSIPMSGLSSHTSDQAQTGPMGAFSGNNTQVGFFYSYSFSLSMTELATNLLIWPSNPDTLFILINTLGDNWMDDY